MIEMNIVVIVKFSFFEKSSFFKNCITNCDLKGLYPSGKATRIEIITPNTAIKIGMSFSVPLSTTILAVSLNYEKKPAAATGI